MISHIHRRTFGSGARAVLAIHCSLGHSGAWRGLGAALGDIATLHAFDLPCHGASGDWDGQGVMHDTATAMALHVLDDLGTDPIDVIGHSFGATVALRMAIEHPGRVRSLIMFEPVFFAPAMADDPDFAPRYAQAMASFDAAYDAGDAVGAAQAFTATWGDGTDWHSVPQSTRDYMAARIGFIRASTDFLVDDCAGLLASGMFARADMPALLLRGAQSPWSAPINTAIARRLPQADDICITGVGHMGLITDPNAVATPIIEFLNRV